MWNGDWHGPLNLNDEKVELISADLTNQISLPISKIDENSGRIFQGSILSGEGFKIENEFAKELLAKNSKHSDVIFPFVVGDTINSDPNCLPSNHAICFWDWTKEKAAELHDVFSICESEVKAERQTLKESGEFKFRSPLPERWWQYGEKRPALFHAIGMGHLFSSHPKDWDKTKSTPKKVLGISTGTTKYPAFTFLPIGHIYSNTLCILADDRLEIFAALSSDIHAIWAWKQRTTKQNNMESMRYAHGLIFETFPFPDNFLQEGDENLKNLGNSFFTERQDYMVSENIGLTEFYNRFHNPQEGSEKLIKLRQFQTSINLTTVELYGWDHINLECGFHKVGYLPEDRNTRYTISEASRVTLLNELSKLNQIKATNNEKNCKITPRNKKKITAPSVLDLFNTKTSDV